MRLSAKGEYGVRAMVMLALNYDSGPLPIREIGEKENISFQFLEQIFLTLRRNELINSVRGAKGGYVLARPPEKIKVGDVLRALEGTLAPVECVSEEKTKGDNSCIRSEDCLSRNIWQQLTDRMTEVLDEISLKDIITPKD